MTRRRTTILFATALGLLAAIGPAGAQGLPQYEAMLGLGGAGAVEANIANLDPDAASEPDVFFDFRIRQNLRGPWAAGFHVFGTAEETDPYLVTLSGQPQVIRFDLAIAHVGLDVRYLLLPGRLRPYLEAGVSYVAGALDHPDTGELRLNGFSFSGGPGIQFDLSDHFALGAEGVFAAGTAKWDLRPFLSSRGRDYDPAFAAVAVTMSYLWGRPIE